MAAMAVVEEVVAELATASTVMARRKVMTAPGVNGVELGSMV